MSRSIATNVEILLTTIHNKYPKNNIPDKINFSLVKLAHVFCVIYDTLVSFIEMKESKIKCLPPGILFRIKEQMSKNLDLEYKSYFACVLHDIKCYISKIKQIYFCKKIPFKIQYILLNLTMDFAKSIHLLIKN